MRWESCACAFSFGIGTPSYQRVLKCLESDGRASLRGLPWLASPHNIHLRYKVAFAIVRCSVLP